MTSRRVVKLTIKLMITLRRRQTTIRSRTKTIQTTTTLTTGARIQTTARYRMLWTGISITAIKTTQMIPIQMEIKTQATIQTPPMKQTRTMIQLPLMKRTQTAIQLPLMKRTQTAIQLPLMKQTQTAIQLPLMNREMAMDQQQSALQKQNRKKTRKLTLKTSATAMVLILKQCLSEARHSTMMLVRSLPSLLRGMPQSSILIEGTLIVQPI